MKWFLKLNIYSKVIVVMFSMIILLGFLLGFIMYDSINKVMDEQLEKRGIEIASHVASLSAMYVLIDNSYALYELVRETINNNEDVRYVLVMNYKGQLLAHTFSEGIPKKLLEVNPIPVDSDYRVVMLDTNEGLVRDVIVPIENGNVGFARIGIAEEFTRNIIRKKVQEFVFTTLGVCAIAALLAAKLTGVLTKPVSGLVQASEEIAGGNLNVRAEIKAEDEIGKLAMTFNHMADSLKKTNNERNELVEILREKEKLRTTLLSKLITAQEDERKRISRELHDETSQALTSLVVSMRILADKAVDDQQRALLLSARDTAANILCDVRDLAVELRPPILDDLGLAAAMKKYITKFQERYKIAVNMTSSISDSRMEGQTAMALYRIMQESLTNIVKHSGAKHVEVSLGEKGNYLELVIADDGQGVLPGALERAKRERRLGIFGMRERAELLGGTLSLTSSIENGTVIIAVIPIKLKES